jgi:zinc transporter ZupT
MKPKIKKMNWFVKLITFGFAAGITLAPFGIYIRKKYYENQAHYKSKRLINHEKIHWEQQMELYILPFYVLYLVEWIVRIFIKLSKAYKSISFEQEANEYEKDSKYLDKRKKYNWFKFL